ncbi:MAG TPA: diacylglycerol kinase family protein [Thermoanaerobaculia bacterium]|jgi:diacylglycerol kinase (ATP)|nr:diacylglycerol kinase family protein [Thermoanaerobaculia bacterium]
MKQLVFLVNPAAGSGRAGTVWDGLVDSHPELRAAPLVRESDPAIAGGKLLQAITGGARRVVALGGDGTAHMVTNVLLRGGMGERVALGLVPAGTGSDLCRSLGIPDAPGAALQLALEGEPRPLDAFEVRSGAGPEAQVRYVVNTASAGVSGVVVEAVNALTRRGAATYLLATVKALLRYRPVRCRVTVDGEPFYEGPIFLLAAANGVTFGKGMKVAPRARTDDGLADVVLVGDMRRWELVFRLPQLYLGRHLESRRTLFRQARRLTCEPLGPFPPYELDGDAAAPDPIELRVLPGALRILR